MSDETAKMLCIGPVTTLDTEDRLVYYYLQACRIPHWSFFPFELQYAFDFMEHFGYDNDADFGSTLIRRAIDDDVWEESVARAHQYYRESRNMKFSIRYYGDCGLGRWTFGFRAIKGEEPASTLLRFKERLEFITGLKLDMERLVFFYKSSPPLTDDGEIVAHAAQDQVLVEVKPRPGHPQNGPWDFFDLLPMIVKILDRGYVFFALEHRFQIWVFVWGTSILIKKLLEVNPNLLERAQSLGVSEDVFNEVLDYQIPSSPGTELLPLELLESTYLVRGLFAYMYAHDLIEDSAGFDLEVKELYGKVYT